MDIEMERQMLRPGRPPRPYEGVRENSGSLRIAVVAPPWYEVPPEAYGGIEAMCFSLVEGLLDHGHDPTLIAAGRSRTRATFLPTFDHPREGLGSAKALLPELTHAARAARILDELVVDVVHDHSVAGPLTAGERLVPTVVTVHGPVDGEARELYGSLSPNVGLVAISDAQRATAPDLPWVATVHNGIPVDEYPFASSKDDFLLFMGRVHPDKGTHVAIDTARRVGMRLVIAAKCTEPIERAYFTDEVAPRLGPDVDWIGEADTTRKKDLFQRARALLFPIDWDEPFGLVMVEAMACGTPVVAMNRGAVPEIVLDGVTGFVCGSTDELQAAVAEVATLDPADCREHVAARFGVPQMVRGYEEVYRSITARMPGDPDAGQMLQASA
jgi:glycosyltransferase involved in cell wall biosynthesis